MSDILMLNICNRFCTYYNWLLIDFKSIYTSLGPFLQELRESHSIYVFNNPCTIEIYDTWSILKKSLTGFKPEFSVYSTSCHTKAKDTGLPVSSRDGGRTLDSYQPQGFSGICNPNNRVHDLIQITVSISHYDNHDTTGNHMYVIIYSFCVFFFYTVQSNTKNL